jgi:hypothetical protein
VLGEPHRETDELEAAQRRQTEPSEAEDAFMSLGADAELDQVIFERRELNALVSAAHHRTGKPHGWIHNELRRLCGGPPVAAASSEQLRARIEAVRGLTA